MQYDLRERGTAREVVRIMSVIETELGRNPDNDVGLELWAPPERIDPSISTQTVSCSRMHPGPTASAGGTIAALTRAYRSFAGGKHRPDSTASATSRRRAARSVLSSQRWRAPREYHLRWRLPRA